MTTYFQIELMSPYYHLFHQEQPGAFNQMRQKGLISMAILWCSNGWMALGLSNWCTWWQIDSVLVFMVYQIPKVCLAFMYTQHMNMVYGEYHIRHYLVLDQNKNDNA